MRLADSPLAQKLRGIDLRGETFRTEPRFVETVGGVVAIIELIGVISQKPSWLSDVALYSWLHTFRAAVNDDSISAILLDVSSTGGSHFGVREAGREIHRLRKEKPIIAVLSGTTAGVGYELASAAGEVVIAPSAMVGGLGHIAKHVDRSKQNAKRGMQVTYITAGRYKVERAPDHPLSDDARSDMLRQIQQLDATQQRTIGRNRVLHPRRVANLFGQGRLIGAEAAVKVGMADRIGTLESEIDRLRTTGRKGNTPELIRQRLDWLAQFKETIAEPPPPPKQTGQTDRLRSRLRAGTQSGKRIPGIQISGLVAPYALKR